ncbi:hypothetical protein IE81DRAFT_322690 [Ceraceosorus guamensis]|uniref:CRAL-TRIO domain-containing protein n=1 Tax=Ceraceosorus guamensis TaxID=1522189 RepID=A0A316VZT4_9BASI|nr:hypothetical protein IE81DRAFT_322690 [Ceraceosorus guamensis]PWN43177.1 hypothetical protein IE81DRAFT_322690 [Ceraceosorus guamensis]
MVGRTLDPPSSQAAKTVAKKCSDLAAAHDSHAEEIDGLRATALEQLPDAIAEELQLGDDAREEVRRFLSDRATLFRFFRRARFSQEGALSLLTGSLLWRIRTDLPALNLSSLHPIFVAPPAGRPPLFWANTRFRDRYRRPCGVINLRSLERADVDGLNEVREYIVACMECIRRQLAEDYARYRQDRKGKGNRNALQIARNQQEIDDGLAVPEALPPLQMVIAISLKSSGIANLEMELLPFLLDLLKNHFPGMVGAIYMMHYGWVHSGMWGLAKRVLPKEALARIFFPSNAEMAAEHFEPDHLLTEWGGDWDVKMTDETNDIMIRHARPARSGRQSQPSSLPGSPTEKDQSARPTLSRTGSFESVLDEYHSFAPSPWASRVATPRASAPATPREDWSHDHPFPSASAAAGSGSPVIRSLQLTPVAARKLHHLQMTRGVPDEDSSATPRARKRATSDPRKGGPADQRQSSSASASGAATPSQSATRSPTHRRPRVRSTASVTPGMGAAASAMTGRRRDRNVHFHASPSISPAVTRDHSPVRRVGSLRDFRLSLPQHVPGTGVDPLHARRGGSGSEGEDSDHSAASGKVGEKLGRGRRQTPTQTRKDPSSSALGFFARWRSGSRGSASTSGDQEKAYRESLRAQQAAQSQVTSPVIDETDAREMTEAERHQSQEIDTPPQSAIDEALQNEPGSPRLQVPFIEEPPLSAGLSGPARYLSRRSRRAQNLPGHVSPYNASNPFWGYPAYTSSSGDGEDSRFSLHQMHPQHMHVRRRKRDLLRTLSYLFVLRLLSSHRSIRAQIIYLWRSFARAVSVGGDADGDGGDKRWREAEDRYKRLRSASRHGEAQQLARQERARLEAERKRLQGQPLARLGIQRRYLVFILLLALLRQDIRARTLNGVKGTTESVKGFLAVTAGRVVLGLQAGAHAEPDTAAAAVSSATSLTGLHLRQRLGLGSHSEQS